MVSIPVPIVHFLVRNTGVGCQVLIKPDDASRTPVHNREHLLVQLALYFRKAFHEHGDILPAVRK
jgi:hypothetical protein